MTALTVRISASNHFYAFDPNIKFVQKVYPKENVIIETLDCFSNQIKDEKTLVTQIDFSKVNPATGPIYIEGATAGDTLVVHINKIKINEKGVIVTVPKLGVLGKKNFNAKTKICKIIGDKVTFSGLEIPVHKMIGVIGVATPERTPCGIPGRHGGNLDTKIISEGSIVYLPVFFDGGLFGLGDLHAVMGDGEVCVAACETRGEVYVSFDVIKEVAPPWPLVETEDHIYILVSNEDLNEAIEEAVNLGVKVLASANSLEFEEAYMLASMVVDVQISQLVNPRKTVRVRIPKKYVSLKEVLVALGLRGGFKEE